jgi:sugar lactone lactonase YvrE
MTRPAASRAAAEQLTSPCTYHGEGPVWDPQPGVLRFVDMYAGAVLSPSPHTQQLTRTHVGTVAAALRPRVIGGLVVAVERGSARSIGNRRNRSRWVRSGAIRPCR